jgi:hypothetical protein
MSGGTAQADCPQCRKRFRLRADAAGKKVKCGCGAVFLVTPPAPTTIATDDLLEPEPVAVPPAVSPLASPLSPMPQRAHSAVAAALLNREDDTQVSPFREVWLPVAMLVVGYLTALFLWSCWLDSAGKIAAVAAIALAVQVLFFTPVMVGSLMLGAKWMDVDVGHSLPGLIRKVAALTLGPAAIADVLFTAVLIIANFDWELIAAGFGFYLVLYGVCTAMLFELSVAQTAFLVLLNFIPRVAAAYPAAVILSNMQWIR